MNQPIETLVFATERICLAGSSANGPLGDLGQYMEARVGVFLWALYVCVCMTVKGWQEVTRWCSHFHWGDSFMYYNVTFQITLRRKFFILVQNDTLFWHCKHLPNQAAWTTKNTALLSSDKVDGTLANRTKQWWNQCSFHRVGWPGYAAPIEAPLPSRCIRLCCSAPLPCRQWWIWFISMVASSAHSHSAGWQWQTGAGSPHNCLASTAEQGRRGRWL